MTTSNPAKEPASPSQQLVTLGGVLIPFAGVVFAIVLLWGRGFSWVELMLLCGMYLATGLGITVGYHRLFTHRAFEAVRPVKFIFAVLGSMGVQGPLLEWAAIHRRHHQFSDEADDPHSPHHFGSGVKGIILGFWHAHMGWMFQGSVPNLRAYVRDLSAQRHLRVANNLFLVWAVLGFLIPTALGALLTGTWFGALLGFLWGGLVRLFLMHHVTWSINSVCHLWGGRRFNSEDQSRNNLVCGVLAFGEGWHNNHHAFPESARHGLRWWEFDMSYIVIRCLELVGLAWAVRVPSRQRMRSLEIPRLA